MLNKFKAFFTARTLGQISERAEMPFNVLSVRGRNAGEQFEVVADSHVGVVFAIDTSNEPRLLLTSGNRAYVLIDEPHDEIVPPLSGRVLAAILLAAVLLTGGLVKALADEVDTIRYEEAVK